jgi:hypothetical protein
VTRVANTGGAEPFVHAFELAAPGAHTIAYRAVDKDGNREDAKTVAVTVVAPPGDPGPGPGPSGDVPGPGPSGGDAAKPNLTAKASKRRLVVKRGAKQVTIRVRLRNTGDAAASRVRVCADLAKQRFRKRLKVAGGKCRATTVGARTTKVVKIKIRVKPGARGKTTPVRIRVGGGAVAVSRFTVDVRARR